MKIISFKEYLLEKKKRKSKKRKSFSIHRGRRPYGVWGYPLMGGFGYGDGSNFAQGGGDGGGGGGDGG